ncbi:class I SAM-dependent methyltransferase [Actinacidiphila glaucinigra]|uniref:class I SAM-dependent methyltransferase n=1 Tax=Actinacidiphila glaucinigra TaxID=235986 RepID=UPI002DDC3F18|nr:class I SAM-dependent methyltransferase [Actinacidiphila glaucinigra]WSD64148.1 class I SAM-dependent methyltransferase [Actinacidiphila glaucinigra]
MTGSPRARSFDRAAGRYAANRPSYPPALLDAVEELAGRPLSGALVADVGAGTGIATALLHDRGARVVAVEPGDGMSAELRRNLPDVALVRGDGDRLPLASGAFDFVTYAQAWHWTDPRRSVPEALRVLRPGGAFALWRNDPDTSVPWIAAEQTRLRGFFAALSHPRAGRLPDGPGFTELRVPWSRRVPVEVHLANIGTQSAFLVIGEERSRAFLAAEREHLTRHFPDGMVDEHYVVALVLAIR